MKDIDDTMNVGEVMEAAAEALALVLATSLPSRTAAMHATIYLAERLTHELAELERAGEANWSVKDKGGLQ